MKRIQYKALEFDRKFVEWVTYKNSGDPPQPIIDSLRDEIASHYIVERPPFAFEHRDAGSYIIQVPSRKTLYLFAVAKDNGRLKVYGGLFHNGLSRVKDDSPFKTMAPTKPVDHGADERAKVCTYLKGLAERAEYADDAEIYEAVIVDLQNLKHLKG